MFHHWLPWYVIRWLEIPTACGVQISKVMCQISRSHRPKNLVKRVNFRVFGHFLENRGGKGLKFGMLMYPDHRPHSRQVTEARYTEGAASLSRADYSSRPTTEAEQWPVRWLQCLIKKWSCVNSQFRLHTQVAYKPHIHDTWHEIQSHQFGNPFLGTLARHVHFRQWLCVCAVKIGASYFRDLFSTCQQVLGHACHIWYSLGLKLLTQNHSTRAGRLRIRCVMTGHDAGMGLARCFQCMGPRGEL